MNPAKRSLVFMCLSLAAAVGVATAAVSKTPVAEKVLIKPDIVLGELEITPLSVLGSGDHRVQIKAIVTNPVARSSTGAFTVRASVKTSADLYFRIADESVPGLANTGATAKAPMATVLFYDTVPIGHTKHYRVTADVWGRVTEINEGNNQRDASYRVPSGIPEGGGDETVVRGVDLVVSQVEVTRGTFAGKEKIQIKSAIRNMWHGSTAERIKVLYTGPGVSFAIWIEGGIGGDETKSSGAFYIDCDEHLSLPLDFSVVVDNSNEIPETNDLNNRCDGVHFGAGDTHVVHECPISGPHEPLI